MPRPILDRCVEIDGSVCGLFGLHSCLAMVMIDFVCSTLFFFHYKHLEYHHFWSSGRGDYCKDSFWEVE